MKVGVVLSAVTALALAGCDADKGPPPGQGNMPAWKDKLSDADIDAVIAWL